MSLVAQITSRIAPLIEPTPRKLFTNNPYLTEIYEVTSAEYALQQEEELLRNEGEVATRDPNTPDDFDIGEGTY